MGCLQRTVVVLGGAILLLWLVGKFSGTSGDSADRSSVSDVESCVARGISYFSSIGAYPMLSDGRKATDTARERCNRTTTAF